MAGVEQEVAIVGNVVNILGHHHDVDDGPGQAAVVLVNVVIKLGHHHVHVDDVDDEPGQGRCWTEEEEVVEEVLEANNTEIKDVTGDNLELELVDYLGDSTPLWIDCDDSQPPVS